MPVLVALLGGVRSLALYHMVIATVAYLLEVQEEYPQLTLTVREHHNRFAANDENQGLRALERRYVSRSAWLFWLLLLGAAIVFAFVAWVNLAIAALSTRVPG